MAKVHHEENPVDDCPKVSVGVLFTQFPAPQEAKLLRRLLQASVTMQAEHASSHQQSQEAMLILPNGYVTRPCKYAVSSTATPQSSQKAEAALTIFNFMCHSVAKLSMCFHSAAKCRARFCCIASAQMPTCKYAHKSAAKLLHMERAARLRG